LRFERGDLPNSGKRSLLEPASVDVIDELTEVRKPAISVLIRPFPGREIDPFALAFAVPQAALESKTPFRNS